MTTLSKTYLCDSVLKTGLSLSKLIGDNFKYEKPIADDKYHLLKYDAKISDDIPDEVWEKADALVTGLYMKVDEPLIKKLKWI